MSYKKLQKMYNAIEIIEADKALALLSVHSYPHLKKSGQQKVVQELKRLSEANKENYKEPPPRSMRELYDRMMRALRG